MEGLRGGITSCLCPSFPSPYPCPSLCPCPYPCRPCLCLCPFHPCPCLFPFHPCPCPCHHPCASSGEAHPSHHHRHPLLHSPPRRPPHRRTPPWPRLCQLACLLPPWPWVRLPPLTLRPLPPPRSRRLLPLRPPPHRLLPRPLASSPRPWVRPSARLSLQPWGKLPWARQPWPEGRAHHRPCRRHHRWARNSP